MWYKDHEQRIPMISRFSSCFFSIASSQIENERDFSLACAIGWTKRAQFYVKNVSVNVHKKRMEILLKKIKEINVLSLIYMELVNIWRRWKNTLEIKVK